MDISHAILTRGNKVFKSMKIDTRYTNPSSEAQHNGDHMPGMLVAYLWQ